MTFAQLERNRPVARYHALVCQQQDDFYDALTDALGASAARTNPEEWDFVAVYLGCPMVDRII